MTEIPAHLLARAKEARKKAEGDHAVEITVGEEPKPIETEKWELRILTFGQLNDAERTEISDRLAEHQRIMQQQLMVFLRRRVQTNTVMVSGYFPYPPTEGKK